MWIVGRKHRLIIKNVKQKSPTINKLSTSSLKFAQ
jgi:hypothetical protein